MIIYYFRRKLQRDNVTILYFSVQNNMYIVLGMVLS